MADTATLPTFTTRQVARALGIDKSTITIWSQRGLLDLFDSKPMPERHQRTFSVADVYRVALIQTMRMVGVAEPEAAIAANRTVLAVDEHFGHIRELNVLYYENSPME